MAYMWAPTTVQVADYVTSRTVSATNPGMDTPLGDFSADTYPTGAQVGRLIDGSCAWLAAELGDIHLSLQPLAMTVAAIHTAAMVELSYPERDADIKSTADALFEEAHRHLETLRKANSAFTPAPGTTDSASALLPVYSFPDPPWYGDTAL